MASFNNQAEPGAFVPLTDVFDSQRIYDLDVDSDEFKEFLVRLRQSVNDIAMVLNVKDTGYYYPVEFVNGQAYFPDPALSSTTTQNPIPRQVFRKVINFGALPNSSTKNVAHEIDITSGFIFTRIYATATDPGTSFIPIPYLPIPVSGRITLSVDTTNVIITTNSNRTNYTICYVVLEYIKS